MRHTQVEGGVLKGIDEKPLENPDEPPLRPTRPNPLMKMGPGHLGKIRVHASGRVTFVAAGDSVSYEVEPGLPVYFAQDVVTISPDEKSLCVLGSVSKKLVCIPEVQSIGSSE